MNQTIDVKYFSIRKTALR